MRKAPKKEETRGGENRMGSTLMSTMRICAVTLNGYLSETKDLPVMRFLKLTVTWAKRIPL